MSELDDAMLAHMAFIVSSEGRPFSYRDFLRFEVNGNEYGMGHGTFRNKISKLIKIGIAELCYSSTCAFYTLKGHKFGKPVTTNHTVVSHNNSVYKMFQELPLDKQSIHDIRLKFKVPNIWQIVSHNSNFYKIKRSNDIAIPAWNNGNAIVKITIHKTDTVSVTIGCSLSPILLDADGIIRFFTLLVRVEERLRNIIDNCISLNAYIQCNLFPEYKSWIVTMWHFGRDGLTEYTGDKFSISVEDAQHIVTRVYSKQMNDKKTRLRMEIQECPNKTVVDIVNERLHENPSLAV